MIRVQGIDATYRRQVTGLCGQSWVLTRLMVPPPPWMVQGQEKSNSLPDSARQRLQQQLSHLFSLHYFEPMEMWRYREKRPALGWRGVACADYPFLGVNESGWGEYSLRVNLSLTRPSWLKGQERPKLTPLQDLEPKAFAAYLKERPYPAAALSRVGPSWVLSSEIRRRLPSSHPAYSKDLVSYLPIYNLSFLDSSRISYHAFVFTIDAMTGEGISTSVGSENIDRSFMKDAKVLALPSPKGEEASVFVEGAAKIMPLNLGAQVSSARQTIVQPQGLILLKSFDVFPCEFGDGFVKIPYGIWRLKDQP